MKALIRKTRKKWDLDLANVKKPEICGHQVLIRIQYAGICGFDMENIGRDIPKHSKIKPPVVIGHEGCGTIEAVGPDAKNAKPGQRVCFQTRVKSCGTCSFCRSGATNLCAEKIGIGSAADGCMAEYIAVPDHCIIPIPDDLPFETAVLLEPLACCVHLTEEQAHCRPGEQTAVIGAGVIGILSALTLKYNGADATLFGTERSRARALHAKTFGADVFCGDQKEILSYVHEKIPALFDKVFVCADTKSAFDTAVGIVKKNGCIALASAPEGRIEVPVGKLFSEQISIISGASQIPSSWYRALKILTETKDQLKGLTECRYDLEDWKEAIKACQNRLGVKILLKP